MRSRRISRRWNKQHFQFSIWSKTSLRELKTSPESDQWFQSYSNWKILKTNEVHSFFWLYLTINSPHFRLIPLDRNTCNANKQCVKYDQYSYSSCVRLTSFTTIAWCLLFFLSVFLSVDAIKLTLENKQAESCLIWWSCN